MITYRQTDPRWSALPINGSQYPVGGYGCLLTANAMALANAGYPEANPGVLSQQPSNFQGPLWSWYGAAKGYPQYRVHLDGSGEFQFVEVTATFSGKRYEHWVLRWNGAYVDPLTGNWGNLPANYAPTGTVRSADIDRPAPTAILTDAVRVPVHLPCHTTAALRVRTSPHVLPDNVLRTMAPGEGFYYLSALESDGMEWLLLEDGHYCAAAYTEYNPTSNA